MHATQLPQCALAGSSKGSSKLVNNSPKKKNEPACLLMSKVCFPVQPRPLFSAKAFSKIGAESANGRDSKGPIFSSIRFASCFSRPRTTL